MKKGFAVLMATLMALTGVVAPVAASPFLNEADAATFPQYTAKAIVYFQNVRAQVADLISDDILYGLTFAMSIASEMFDMAKLESVVTTFLATADEDGDGIADYANYVAHTMANTHSIKADVITVLTSDTVFDEFVNDIYTELTGVVHILSEVVYKMATV